MNNISKQVANEFDRPVSDLKRKRYHWTTNIHEMKKEFVKRCYEEGISNKAIAEYMGHYRSVISNLHRKAVGKKTYKYEKIITHMEQNGIVKKEDFTKLRSHISELRKKGYQIYFDQQGYRLA